MISVPVDRMQEASRGRRIDRSSGYQEKRDRRDMGEWLVLKQNQNHTPVFLLLLRFWGNQNPQIICSLKNSYVFFLAITFDISDLICLTAQNIFTKSLILLDICTSYLFICISNPVPEVYNSGDIATVLHPITSHGNINSLFPNCVCIALKVFQWFSPLIANWTLWQC